MIPVHFSYDNMIRGERIRLKPIIADDIETIRNWRNKDVIRSNFIYSGIISYEQQLSWWEKYNTNVSDEMFIIECISDNKQIGTLALYNIESGEKAEFGRLMIGEELYLGRGYALEALTMILFYAFEELKLKQVYLEVFSHNLSAIHIYMKAGFVCGKTKDDLIFMYINNPKQ